MLIHHVDSFSELIFKFCEVFEPMRRDIFSMMLRNAEYLDMQKC
jgi:hypothetical protein